jgi:5-methyltetrahydropteroyltriglutamate--homocysteine methyltransferase
VKLPDGKILAPGVVTHATPIVEHPELVSQRIQRFARLVGRENVIASTDCGLAALPSADRMGQAASVERRRRARESRAALLTSGRRPRSV